MEVNFKGLMEELWDEFSYQVDDDLDSLQYVAGRTVITENDYKKLVVKLDNLLNGEQTKKLFYGTMVFFFWIRI